jgi:uncharacterized membrane protein YphA (DoxX/SURF4 family)
MQRLFSMFPQGAPGFALLLLRISVATIFLTSIANQSLVSSVPLVCAGVLLISGSLSIGFLTPYLSVVSFVSGVAILLLNPHSYSVVQVALLFNAAALALLGPGAYSVDARLFGLRVTVLRPGKDPTRF